MKSSEIRQKFLNFFQARGHAIVPSSSLLPDDPSVLLTTAGMQQFKPYFTGEGDPVKDFGSKNTVSIQKCFRTSDIEEVGDERHLTFFEMLGNFSFGGYFKKEAIQYGYDFIIKELGLKIDYVTVFAGEPGVPADEESAQIWRSLDSNVLVKQFGRADNFWGPTGAAGPCGPTTEIYVDGVEVWNIVFNQYYQAADGKLTPLATPGIDTGMGLERLTKVMQKVSTVFETDLFIPALSLLPGNLDEKTKRIVADHARAISFLIADGVRPANKGAGYILRRLMRRVIFYGGDKIFTDVLGKVIEIYQSVYPELKREIILEVFSVEADKFQQTLSQGLRELDKVKTINAISAFKLFESYGLPFDIIHDKFPELNKEEFEAEFKKHQDISRSGLEKKFTGGLADHEPATIKLHTAHHLLLAALQQVLGPQVKQRGSNVTSERLRLDFIYPEKLSDEQKKQVEEIVNTHIKAALPVEHKEMPKSEAEKLGAEMEFGQKYGEEVSVYLIGNEGNYVSREFCGGPHVGNTSELGVFKITKEEAVAAGVRRIRAELTQ